MQSLPGGTEPAWTSRSREKHFRGNPVAENQSLSILILHILLESPSTGKIISDAPSFRYIHSSHELSHVCGSTRETPSPFSTSFSTVLWKDQRPTALTWYNSSRMSVRSAMTTDTLPVKLIHSGTLNSDMSPWKLRFRKEMPSLKLIHHIRETMLLVMENPWTQILSHVPTVTYTPKHPSSCCYAIPTESTTRMQGQLHCILS